MTSPLLSNDDIVTIDDAVNAPVSPMPSVSSKIIFAQENLDIKHDVWIVGAGILGEEIVKEWKRMRSHDTIIAETKTINRHSTLASYGAIPMLREARVDENDRSARTVIIAIPPSATSEKKIKTGYSCNAYVEELSEATRLWAGPAGGGSLIFTSSIGIYGDSLGSTVTEDFRVDCRSQKALSLINAEEAVVTRGGAVVRLAGLYLAKRGPHSYWLTQDTVDSAADGIINMIHYEDAASVVVKAALHNAGKLSSVGKEAGICDQSFRTIFLACDDKPVTRKEICMSAAESGLFPDAKIPVFSSESGPISKKVDSSLTRELLSFTPKYKSFPYYMRSVIGGKPDHEDDNNTNSSRK